MPEHSVVHQSRSRAVTITRSALARSRLSFLAPRGWPLGRVPPAHRHAAPPAENWPSRLRCRVFVVTHMPADRALCESVLLSCSESVLLSCSNSPSWPSRSRCLVSVVAHRPADRSSAVCSAEARRVSRKRPCGLPREHSARARASGGAAGVHEPLCQPQALAAQTTRADAEAQRVASCTGQTSCVNSSMGRFFSCRRRAAARKRHDTFARVGHARVCCMTSYAGAALGEVVHGGIVRPHFRAPLSHRAVIRPCCGVEEELRQQARGSGEESNCGVPRNAATHLHDHGPA